MQGSSKAALGDMIETHGASGNAKETVSGRSLWGYAFLRLKKNRAALASLVILVVITALCIIGPWVSPHDYDTVYRQYVRVPASLKPYPRKSNIIPKARAAVERGHVRVDKVTLDGSRVLIDISSSRNIDPRITRYVDRSDLFSNTRVVATSDGGRSMILQADIQREWFLFGTDANGRDLMTRTLIAGRVSLAIGLLASVVSLIIGTIYGAIAGYLGGRTDGVMMRIVDVLYSLPFMFLVILLVVFFGRNFILMFIAVGAIEWLDMARIVRGQTLMLRRQEFIEAAESLGVRTPGILKRHVIPNLLGPVIIYVTLLVPKVILLESFLSFLGLGVQEPMTSWGVLISEGARSIRDGSWLLIFPSIFLTVTLFALNFLGDGLRDALDPKDR